MVDAAIVMIENVHKHIEREPLTDENRWRIIREATMEVGPALFFSLLIITLSFLPVFTLEAQEGRLFAPLAFTKTYAMAAAAGLSITLVPVLMGYFIRGHIKPEHENPVNRYLINGYKPFIHYVLEKPKKTLKIAAIVTVTIVIPMAGFTAFIAPLKWPAQVVELFKSETGSEDLTFRYINTINNVQNDIANTWKGWFSWDKTGVLRNLATGVGSEFMPDLDEGDLMYMPTTFPGISVGKAQELLQQTDKLIRTVPEVRRVFGKIGRAETATDPAPLTMIETTILLKPRSEWRDGMTLDKLKQELNNLIKFPGLTNAWVMPIKTRIDMLAPPASRPRSGSRSPVRI